MNAPQLNLSDAVLDEVFQCLSRGHKLVAVKILRNAAGISLLEAKQVADQLEAEKAWLRISETSAAGATNDDWRIAGKRLLQEGKKLDAIQLCQKQTGLSLQLAKEKVEELAAREGIPDQGIGCLPVAVVVFILAAAIAGGIWLLIG